MADSKDSTSLLDVSSLRDLKNPRVAIIKTEWNDKITKLQVDGALRISKKFGVKVTEIATVPGSVELPFGIKKLYSAAKHLDQVPESIIAFGAVIRGGTPHFEYVCKMVTDGIMQLNLTLPIPVIFGVLTLEDEHQAIERLGGIHGHKGEEAMITALKMIQFSRERGRLRLSQNRTVR